MSATGSAETNAVVKTFTSDRSSSPNGGAVSNGPHVIASVVPVSVPVTMVLGISPSNTTVSRVGVPPVASRSTAASAVP